MNRCIQLLVAFLLDWKQNTPHRELLSRLMGRGTRGLVEPHHCYQSTSLTAPSPFKLHTLQFCPSGTRPQRYYTIGTMRRIPNCPSPHFVHTQLCKLFVSSPHLAWDWITWERKHSYKIQPGWPFLGKLFVKSRKLISDQGAARTREERSVWLFL